jgi:prepilin-type N-terminal cleavage/methylation domain-containing protein
MKDTCAIQTRVSKGGFSLLEMMIVVAIILVLGALALPRVMTQVYSIRIQYSATDLSGVLQRARMEAVRKNTFYAVQYVAGNPAIEQIVDKNLALPVPVIPPAVLGSSVTSVYGTGSGAPGEAAFVTSLNFPTGVAAAATGLPSFNARGIPCVRTSTTVCTQVAGQGFVFFLSGTSGAGAAVGWSAVAVTPSGRCEVFSYDGTNWSQR